MTKQSENTNVESFSDKLLNLTLQVQHLRLDQLTRKTNQLHANNLDKQATWTSVDFSKIFKVPKIALHNVADFLHLTQPPWFSGSDAHFA